MSFNHKRDRIQIIAEILSNCRTPQTQTFIRRQTHLSYAMLQSYLMQLLGRQWLLPVQGDNKQAKFIITHKGQSFLEKWIELQKLTGIKDKQKLVAVQIYNKNT
ncbi:MAG: winged helix-turn-helix domain-containing protein [Nitrososphaerota archaeon]|nr:winged helix-turn-helix domain-containing protein [Nitrososphaerota archaeon]